MDKLEKIKQFGIENKIPIIEDLSLEYLRNIIIENNCLNILEIGTAIGYSAINMALINSKISVTTIEKNEKLFLLAKENVKNLNLEKRITLINNDALEVNLNEKYDLIFIDAAKSKYINFFEKFHKTLNNNGVIVSDNIELLKLKKKTNNKQAEKLLKKMEDYKNYLKNNKNFTSEFVNVGDGIIVTRLVK